MDKTVRVAVLGRSYPLRVRESDEGFTLRVAALVDERVQAMERQAPGHPELTHAVIAALSLGEELLTALDELEASRRELESAQAALAEGSRQEGSPAADLGRFRADADALADRLEAALGGGDGASSDPLPPLSEGSAPSADAGAPEGETRANLEGPSAVLPSPAGRDGEAPEGADDEETGADSSHPKTP